MRLSGEGLRFFSGEIEGEDGAPMCDDDDDDDDDGEERFYLIKRG